MQIKRGILRAFDSTSYKATVELAGSIATYLSGLSVARNIAAVEMLNGRNVAVLFFEASNPNDAVVIAVWV
jgi:hypothetical protein